MALAHSTATRNAICDAVKAQSGSSMKINILASNDSVLASFTVNFGTSSEGSIPIIETDIETTGLATGAPAKWQLTTSADTVVLSNTDMTGVTVSPNSITVDQVVRLESFAYTAAV